MKKLIVHEKAEDLSSLLLGLKEDANRKRFDETVVVLEQLGITVERFDAIHHPDRVKPNDNVPKFIVDDKEQLSGRYPQVSEVASWFDLDMKVFDQVTRTGILTEANSKRVGLCCGVGQDVYLDPNHEDVDE